MIDEQALAEQMAQMSPEEQEQMRMAIEQQQQYQMQQAAMMQDPNMMAQMQMHDAEEMEQQFYVSHQSNSLVPAVIACTGVFASFQKVLNEAIVTNACRTKRTDKGSMITTATRTTRNWHDSSTDRRKWSSSRRKSKCTC